MRVADISGFSWRSVTSQKLRAGLMLTAMAIGVAAVVVLVALGEGARGYVTNQFSSLGTNLVIVFPGRSETSGTNPGLMLSRAARDLTVDDALALRAIAGVQRVAPITVGLGDVKSAQRVREAPIIGTTVEWIEIRRIRMAEGSFLPAADPRTYSPVCVIGSTVRQELFGSAQATGQWVRIGDRKFRVAGILEPKGQGLGLNNDEIVIVPVAAAQALFNSNTVFRILIEGRQRDQLNGIRAAVESTIAARHQGELDVTVLTEDAVLATFDNILITLTLAVSGIAAISLAVAGILVMNIMLIAVTQRRTEIGLLKALGASSKQIRTLFVSEGALLSFCGAAVGLACGELGSLLLRRLYPAIPTMAPAWAATLAVLTALFTGTIFALLPARRAAELDPIRALARR